MATIWNAEVERRHSYFEIVPPKEEDLDALGFASFADYRVWCLCKGFKDGLSQTNAERQPTLSTGQMAVHDTQDRREAIRRTIAGEVDCK